MRPAIRSALQLLTAVTLLLTTVLVGAGAATAAATPTPSPSGSGSQEPCPDPGLAPAGLSAVGALQQDGTVTATITWTPLHVPARCGGTVEIEQVTPPGPATTAAFDVGRKVITGLSTFTSYTWRVRYNAGTVSQWGTVTMPQVLSNDYCLAVPGPRTITGSPLSPTSVHLEWGNLHYYDECGRPVRITSNAGTPPVTVSVTKTGVDITGLTPGATYTWTVAVLVTLGSVTITQPPSTDPTPTCAATLHEDAWGTGLVGTVTVRNSSTVPLTRWAVQVKLQPGLRVEQIWGAAGSPGTGVLDVTNLSWNATLAAGGSTTFGYLARFDSPSTVVPTLTCTAG
jgi:cellulase/cellobiase CelA1